MIYANKKKNLLWLIYFERFSSRKLLINDDTWTITTSYITLWLLLSSFVLPCSNFLCFIIILPYFQREWLSFNPHAHESAVILDVATLLFKFPYANCSKEIYILTINIWITKSMYAQSVRTSVTRKCWKIVWKARCFHPSHYSHTITLKWNC